jgi:hypothetical protein
MVAKDVILLGDVAERGAEMIEIRCGRCDRAGRLSVARLIAEHGPGAAIGYVLQAQAGDYPKREASQLQDRCDPYCPDLSAPVPYARRESGCQMGLH